jgi:BatD DUF11 like domain
VRVLRSVAAVGLALGLACASASADDAVHVTARIVPQGRITDTTQVRLVVEVSGTSSPDVSMPDLPPMTNLRVVSGPYTQRQSSMSFVNGAVTSQSSMTLTYMLLPKHAGPAAVPPFTIQVGSASYRTSALNFSVVAGGGPPAASQRPGRAAPGEDEDDDASADIALETHLSSPTVWQGQPVVVETTLYAAARVTGFDWVDDPAISGAWVDTPPVDTQHEAAQVQRGGRTYIAYPIARKVLVPTRAGTIAIPSAAAQIQVERSPRDRFGLFFGLQPAVTVVRRTTPLTLKVRPLPEAGQPNGFAGAVGSYHLAVTEDRRQAQVGDAIAVRATVEGMGSLQAVPPPALVAPPDVKIYDPKVLTNEPTGATHLSSRKTWEWVVVPLKPGTLALPAVSFSYFDTDSGGYKTLRTELPEIAVVRGAATPDTGLARGEVQPSLRDIAFIKTLRGPLREPADPLGRRPWFIALLALPALLSPFGIWAGRRRARLATDHGFRRGRRAARAAVRRLEKARTRTTDAIAFHEEVARALVEYVADRTNRPAAGMTYDELEAILVEKGVSPELRRRYRTCLETCDFARFTPDAGRGTAREDLTREAREIVQALEEAW